jgi:hypothetical protein
MKTAFDTKYHTDGSVTVWNVYHQTWLRCQPSALSDRVLASLSSEERAKVLAHKPRRATR